MLFIKPDSKSHIMKRGPLELGARGRAEEPGRYNSQQETRVVIHLHGAVNLLPLHALLLLLQMDHHGIALRGEDVVKVVGQQGDARHHAYAAARPQFLHFLRAGDQRERQDETVCVAGEIDATTLFDDALILRDQLGRERLVKGLFLRALIARDGHNHIGDQEGNPNIAQRQTLHINNV